MVNPLIFLKLNYEGLQKGGGGGGLDQYLGIGVTRLGFETMTLFRAKNS